MPNGIAGAPSLRFNLSDADLTTAERVAAAIDARLGSGTAHAVDAVSIDIAAPAGETARIALMAQIEAITVTPAEPPARVIVNARTGTIVINGAVRIAPAAVSHGKLTVRIDENPRVSQPAPLSRGETAIEQNSTIAAEERRAPMYPIAGARLSDIVAAVNRIGASPADLVAILEALKQAGALKAELIVL